MLDGSFIELNRHISESNVYDNDTSIPFNFSERLEEYKMCLTILTHDINTPSVDLILSQMIMIRKKLSLQEEIDFRYGGTFQLKQMIRTIYNIDVDGYNNTRLMKTILRLTHRNRTSYQEYVTLNNDVIREKFGLIKFLSEVNPNMSIDITFDKYLNLDLVHKIIICTEDYLLVPHNTKNVLNTMEYMQCDFPVYINHR